MRLWLSMAIQAKSRSALSPPLTLRLTPSSLTLSSFRRERQARLTRLHILAKKHHSSHVPVALFNQFQGTSEMSS
jgi:hypothetical protein